MSDAPAAPPSAPDDRTALLDFLARRDVACPGCGYNLRGLTTDRCPECNQELVLGVRLAEPKLATWVSGLVGLTMGLGFCGIVGAWAVYVLLQARVARPTWSELAPLMGGAVTLGLGLWVWIRSRRRLTTLSAGVRTGLALACWVVSATFVIWFFGRTR